MMDGFGFPSSAGHFRFRGELKAVTKSVGNLRSSISVLDLGSGMGFWTEYFAQRFARVVSVEASPTLYESLRQRSSSYPNVTPVNDDALSFKPPGKFGLVFLGGLLMYLNDKDVRTLLGNLTSCLEPDGLILCRESTIRQGTQTLQGDYQVVYRSVETYEKVFADAGFDLLSVQANIAYIYPQMACELVKKWKAHVPERLVCLPVVGRFIYWGLRLGYPWNAEVIPRLLDGMGYAFPKLTNHFFVLRPSSPTPANGRADATLRHSHHGPEVKEGTR